jgi:hypothetical protein
MTHERRKHERLRLRLPVLILGSESDIPIRSETSNISNDGFYCTSPQPFSPGDSLACLIVLPAEPSDSKESPQFCIEGRVEVVRLVVDNQKGFGIGCRFGQYHVIPRGEIPSWAGGLDRLAINESTGSDALLEKLIIADQNGGKPDS